MERVVLDLRCCLLFLLKSSTPQLKQSLTGLDIYPLSGLTKGLSQLWYLLVLLWRAVFG